MHLQYAAKDTADAQADAGQHSARLQEMCAAAEAVTEAELLQLGLPVLRSVNSSFIGVQKHAVVHTKVCTGGTKLCVLMSACLCLHQKKDAT